MLRPILLQRNPKTPVLSINWYRNPKPKPNSISVKQALMAFSSSPPRRSSTLHSYDLNLTLSPPRTKPPPSIPIISTTTTHHHQNHGQVSHRRIRLTELLLTCAAHTASSNIPCAEACFRLISSLSSASGDSMQRLAAQLANALAARLLRARWAGLLFALHHPDASPRGDPARAHLAFARALPYLPVARAAAACTVLRAVAAERAVHLLDLGPTGSSLDLWGPLIRALARKPGGPPRLKLTCVGTDHLLLDGLGSALAKEAEAVEMPLQFNQINSPVSELDASELRVRPGEALAVVSILSLHDLLAEEEKEKEAETEEEEEEDDWIESIKNRQSPSKIDGFLATLRAMSPKVVVVVEQETDHNSGRMVERFAEAVNYYGAIFDSVEAAAEGGMMEEEERAAVEEMLGREMENVVACEGEERVARHERTERWAERMRRAGLRQAKVWYDAVEEAKRMVVSWSGKGSYGVAVDRGCLMICWKDRPLFAVSVWH